MLRRLIKIIFIVLIAVVVFSNIHIIRKSDPYLYESSDSIPKSKFGVVLGTNKYLLKGGLNEYFKDRVTETSILYHDGIIGKIIVSGHAEGKYYNEPEQLKKELIKLGISPSDILIDTTGDRTLNTIEKLKSIDITDSVTIISQKFHNQRAVFLAREMGVEAVGYNVPDQLTKKNYKTYIREVFAKTIAFIEIIKERMSKLLK